MTLDDILHEAAKGPHSTTIARHQVTIDWLMIDRNVVNRLRQVIYGAIGPSPVGFGSIGPSLEKACKDSFHFGLIIGLLLGEPTDHREDDDKPIPCFSCDYTGQVCFGCARPKSICRCGDFTPVECLNCGGSGTIR